MIIIVVVVVVVVVEVVFLWLPYKIDDVDVLKLTGQDLALRQSSVSR